jgi:spore coat polysaccharide biosynthesis predicted glycosyltransferase SpsG
LREAHQRAIKQAGMRLLVVDDRGETATDAADVVLNQNATATAELYAHVGAKLLLGLPYVLIRREFRALDSQKTREAPLRVLVTFGGADTENLTPVAIEALASLDVHAVVIAGPANPRAASLSVPSGARATIEILPRVDDMAERMHWADLAIVAAGSTCWELAACATPMIAIPVAENQLAVSESLKSLGIGVPLSLEAADAGTLHAAVQALAGDLSRRESMGRRGRELIDGLGALRVCAALRDDGAVR